MRRPWVAAASMLVIACAAGPDAAAQKPFVPTDAYETRTVRGWTVRVNKDLLQAKSDLGERALALLEEKLGDVERAVPAKALARLREITIWLGVDDGHAPCAEYHPSERWLVEHGYNPDKARCVEIGNAARFVEWSKTQPSMVLHELAHGFHDRVLGKSHEGIIKAYEQARGSKLYERVRRANGGYQRHYGLTDAKEFFAEMTEAYFGRNDFYPFDRVDLEAHDPALARAIGDWWNTAGTRGLGMK